MDNPIQSSPSSKSLVTNPIVRLKSKPTYKHAIHAMCAHCVGCTTDHLEPSFSCDIRDCTSHSCPLWHFRPYKDKSLNQDTKCRKKGVLR